MCACSRGSCRSSLGTACGISCVKMGAPTDVLASRPDIVDRLYDLAEGEPLVLRYYAEDIWSMGEAAPRLTIDDLAQMRPGFGAYFERWLDDQERLWGEDRRAS